MLSMQPHRLSILAIVDVMSGTPTGKTIAVGGGYGEDMLAPMPWGGGRLPATVVVLCGRMSDSARMAPSEQPRDGNGAIPAKIERTFCPPFA
jgi:hypothetical protein